MLLSVLNGCQKQTAVKTQYTYHLIQISRSEYHSLKKGGSVSGADCTKLSGLAVAWYYNWSPNPEDCADIKPIGMIWGKAEIGKPCKSEYCLLWNEPDFCDQSNISIAEAVLLWESVESEYADKLLVSPAMGQGGLNTDPAHCGVVGMWLPVFREKFREHTGRYPRFDAIAFHCYILNDDWLTDCKQRLAQHIQWSIDWGAEGVWITEYGFVPDAPVPNPYTKEQAVERERQWLIGLEQNQYIKKYAHFIVSYNDAWGGCAWLNGCEKFSLYKGDQLSDFGKMYYGF